MQLRTSLVCLGIMALNVACSDKGSGDGDDGNGGSSSTAGNGSGGSSTSGSSNTSGKTGGGSETGGTESGEAGSPATGEGGSGTGSGVTKSYTFDTAIEGFVVSDSSAAEEVEPVTKADVMLAHNDAEGEPAPGSLQMDIPFSLASQYVSTGVDTRPATMRAETDPGPDMSGKTITAWVRIESGYGEAEELMTAPGNAKLYAKTGPEYVYGSAAVANLTEVGVWVQLTFEVDFPGYKAADTYDPTDVREIGIQFDTNSASTTAAPAVVLVDTISY
jgi:hypothetical protein